MSAKQWRMSPTRYSPVTSGSTCLPSVAASCSPISRTVTLCPLPTLTARAVGAVALEREPERACDVVHRDEVAPLQSVLEDHAAGGR